MGTQITQNNIMKILDECYEKCLNGIPKISKNVEDLADDYLKKYPSRKKAAKEFIKNQILKCTTSGFLTGFGGIITLPLTVPVNIGSVLYVQMRMITCLAYIGGYEINSDQVQTLVYACLAGVSVNQVLKNVGIKVGVKLANGAVKKIPGKVLIKINQKVGFRLVTKFGTKGVVNLGKMIPVVSAVIGGGMDYAETKIIADRAYKWFLKGDFSVNDETELPEEFVDEQGNTT